MKNRSQQPSRIDFSRYIPAAPPDPEREAEWERDLQRRHDDERRHARRKHFDAASGLRVTDAVERALIAGCCLAMTPALAAVRGWLEGPCALPWLVLTGKPGSGKSVAAAWALCEHGGVWTHAERATRAFSALFGQEALELAQMRDCHTLVLDDVGREMDAQRMQSLLAELLDTRKSRRYRTIITTNLGRRAFTARYPDERLVWRMAESVQWALGDERNLRTVPPEGQR